jgi:hypothetical protein
MPSHEQWLLFLEAAQLAVKSTVAIINSANVNLLSCFIISVTKLNYFHKQLLHCFNES